MDSGVKGYVSIVIHRLENKLYLKLILLIDNFYGGLA